MQDFIRDENLKLYRAALAQSTDEKQRRVLLALLRRIVVEKVELAGPSKHIEPAINQSF